MRRNALIRKINGLKRKTDNLATDVSTITEIVDAQEKIKSDIRSIKVDLSCASAMLTVQEQMKSDISGIKTELFIHPTLSDLHFLINKNSKKLDDIGVEIGKIHHGIELFHQYFKIGEQLKE